MRHMLVRGLIRRYSECMQYQCSVDADWSSILDNISNRKQRLVVRVVGGTWCRVFDRIRSGIAYVCSIPRTACCACDNNGIRLSVHEFPNERASKVWSSNS